MRVIVDQSSWMSSHNTSASATLPSEHAAPVVSRCGLGIREVDASEPHPVNLFRLSQAPALKALCTAFCQGSPLQVSLDSAAHNA